MRSWKGSERYGRLWMYNWISDNTQPFFWGEVDSTVGAGFEYYYKELK